MTGAVQVSKKASKEGDNEARVVALGHHRKVKSMIKSYSVIDPVWPGDVFGPFRQLERKAGYRFIETGAVAAGAARTALY